MTGKLAVDFGTSNTVVAVWDDTRREGATLHIPEYGHFLQQGEEPISLIPSLIHYEGERRWIGGQVIQQGLLRSPQTFRWMKRYILNRSPYRLRLDGRQVSPFDAGRDFLSAVLVFAAQELGSSHQEMVGDEEIALTVPVESFEHYENWLSEVAAQAGMPRFRLIDEPSAAALGYGASIRPGDIYLIFDFGGGTLDVSVVLIEAEEEARSGRRCRVLGKAGVEIGGITIDQWLFQEVLRRSGRSDADEDVRQVSSALLVECERAKERLSFEDTAEVSVSCPGSGSFLQAAFNRSQFEDLLDQHDAFAAIDRTLRRALNAARERGYQEEDLKAVLMVGGSSQIPPVQRMLGRIFGRERVMLNRPLDAIARGAAAFVAGVDFYDYIQHDYAIRTLNREAGNYDYLTLVRHGTPYPTLQPVARLSVKATYDGQTHLGIAIFEVGERPAVKSGLPVELVFDPSGAARVSQLTLEDEERRERFWMNESHPTFLHADPPARQGEARFEAEFSIDGNKRLLITSRDLRTGAIVQKDVPVVKLV